MSGIWEWFENKEWEYQEKDDRQRMAMVQVGNRAFDLRERQPLAMVNLLKQARDKACALGEPWWVFLYDVWIAFGLEEHGDLPEALKKVLYCVHEARKPALQGHPWRLAAYNQLLNCYVQIDPIGYASAIQKSIRELSREIPPGGNAHRYVMMCHQRDFLFAGGKFAQAHKVATRHLALFDQDDFASDWYLLSPLHDLCYVAWHRQEWDEVQSFAEQAEEIGRRHDNAKEDVALAQLWQALVARKKGDEARAKRLHRTALNLCKRMQKSFYSEFYDARAWFHELGEDLEQALQVREDQLKRIQGKGRHGYECDVLIKKCDLLTRLGRLTRHDLQAAQDETGQLKNPKPYRSRIRKLTKFV